MKRALFLLVFGLFFFFVSQSTVLAADSPHNEAGGIGCSDCHGMSLVQNSPFWTTANSDAAYNRVCADGRCHGVDDPGEPYGGPKAPQAHSHAPYGGAEIMCTECHHNHDQDQIYIGKNYKSQFFIATASPLGLPYPGTGLDAGKTHIPYDPATWSGIGKWSDPALLDKKTSAGRGAQLVPDRNSRQRWPIYMVTNVDTTNNIITIKGSLSSAPNIGLFYGQLIRRTINNISVRLFNNEGSNSFVDAAGTGVCQVCHTSTAHFQSTPDAGRDTHNAGQNCSTCHKHQDTSGSGEAFKPSIDHDGTAVFADGPVDYPLASDPDDCDLCHAGDTISGTDTHKGQCALCHDTADYSFKTVAEIQATAGGRAVVDYMPTTADGMPNTCGDCHGTHQGDWYFHEVDHVVKGWVTPNTDTNSNTVNCAGCHDASNILTGVHDQVTQSGLRATACQQCHTDADPQKAVKGSALGHGEAGPGFGNPNQCNTCHDTYFENHDHHDTKPPNDVTYNVAVDTSQASVTGCAECHNDKTGNNTSLNNWTGIVYEHDVNDATQDGTGACVNCHDYDGSKSVPLADVQTAITSGSAATCATCHTDKVPNIDHGGHVATDFNYDAACTTCHLGTDVVADVHGNTCTICHGAGYVRIDGDPTNGVDGDARLADALGDPRADATCLTCHPDAVVNATAGDWKYATMHHDGKTGFATPTGNCTLCHNTLGFTADHTSTTSLATNCADCHTTTPVGNNNISNSDSKKHDVCTSCHSIDTGDNYFAKLIDPASNPLVTAMDDNGTLGGTDGGGDCEACHTSTFVGYHATVDHDPMVDNYVNCVTCHSGTEALTPGPVPRDASDPAGNKKHDACTTCHDAANGRLTGIASGNNGGDDGGNNGGGSCDTCHGEYFDSHTNIDHSVTVALDSDTSAKNDCFDCHDGTQGTSTTVLTGTGDDKLHDNCSTCHTETGILTGASAIAPTMPNGGTAAGKDGGSAVGTGGCKECHGTYFDSHVHGTGTNHTITYTPGVGDDQSQTPAKDCVDCHTPTGGLATWTGVLNEHSASCSTCHDYSGITTADGTPPVSNNDGAIVNNTVSTCLTCHAPKETPASHGYYDHLTNPAGGLAYAPISAVGDCNICHRPIGTEEVVYDVHGGNCNYCHPSGSPPGLITSTPDLAQFAGTTTACTDCHQDSNNTGFTYAFHGTAINHSETSTRHNRINGSNSNAEKNCANCHIMGTNQQKLDLHMDTGDAVVECTICHFPNNYNSLSDTPAQTVIADGKEHNGNDAVKNCESCHTGKGVYSMHGLTDDNGTDGVADVHDKLADSTGIAPTFTNTKILLEQSDYSCYQCHDIDQTVSNNTAYMKRIQVHTSANGTGSGTCLTCHNSIAGFESVIDSGREALHHVGGGGNADQDCESCHNSIINGGGSTNSPSSQAMYQYDGTRHHTTSHAQAGDCTWCHNDPRPVDIIRTTYGWAGTATSVSDETDGWESDYSLTGFTIEKQLACRLCHSNYDATDLQGTTRTTTGLIIYKNSYTPTTYSPNNTTAWGVTNDAPVVQTAMTSHTITSGSKIQVEDYGACLSCHSVQVWHAKPTWDKGNADGNGSSLPANGKDDADDIDDNLFDALRQAPGRTYYNNATTPTAGTSDANAQKLKFNIFSTGVDTGGVTKVRMYGRYDFKTAGKPYDSSASKDRGKSFYQDYKNNTKNPWISNIPAAPSTGLTTIPDHNTVTDGETMMSSNPDVPYFINVISYEVDDITIDTATWNGTTLSVTWTSSLLTGETFNFTYSDDASCDVTPTGGIEDNGDNTYTVACTTSSYYAVGATVIVTSTSATDGGSATASVVDNGGNRAASAADDTYTGVREGVTTSLNILANDSGTGVVITSVGTPSDADCAVSVNGNRIDFDATDAGCDSGAGTITFTYYIADYNGGTSNATVTVSTNAAPTLSISQPAGGDDSVESGVSFNVTFALSDEEEAVTAAFYYDTDNSGLDGTAISGCNAKTEAETTCAWSTSGLDAGDYYVYGITNDGIDPDVTAYSSDVLSVVCTDTLSRVAGNWEFAYRGTTESGTVTGISWNDTGNNRLIVVAMVGEENGNGTRAPSASIGGTVLTQINNDDGSQDSFAWMGYYQVPDSTTLGTADLVYDVDMGTSEGIFIYYMEFTNAVAEAYDPIYDTCVTDNNNDPQTLCSVAQVADQMYIYAGGLRREDATIVANNDDVTNQVSDDTTGNNVTGFFGYRTVTILNANINPSLDFQGFFGGEDNSVVTAVIKSKCNP